MNDHNPQSTTYWIEQLKRGNREAAAKMWEYFFERLVQYSQSQLERSNRRVVDGEDVAIGVMTALCSCAERGKLPTIESRDDLWRILLSWTRHDIADLRRTNNRIKRGGGKVRGESVFGTQENGLDQLRGQSMPADVIVELADQWSRLLQQLPGDSLREVAAKRIQGCSIQEIADCLDVSPRTVERKLKIIRDLWSPEIEPDARSAGKPNRQPGPKPDSHIDRRR